MTTTQIVFLVIAGIGFALMAVIIFMNLARDLRYDRRVNAICRRPDYALIARLERDLFGEIFPCDGAPSASGVIRVPGVTMAEFGEGMRRLGYWAEQGWITATTTKADARENR